MKLEGVCVCSNMGDFLAHTIPFNKYVFNKLVVVTGTKDEHVADICQYHNILCVKTNVLDESFNKGLAINAGLSYLDRSDYLCHFDCDILFPPRARYMMEIAKLREDTLYGVLRQMVPSYAAFAEWLTHPIVEAECDIYLHNKAFPIGTQIGKLSKDPNDPSDLGWLPCGYTQIWNEKDGNHRKYPEEHNTYARSDLQFAYQWDRKHRALIPEFSVLHLQTDDNVKQGINWSGRKTRRFGPEKAQP